MPAWRKRDQGQDPLGWMFTFSDVVTLIFTFFVMMLALRQPDLTRYEAAFGESGRQAREAKSGREPPPVGGPLKALDSLLASGPASGAPAGGFSSQPPRLAAEMELPDGHEGLPRAALQAGLPLKEDPRGTAITLANDLLFSPGSAWLSPLALGELHRVAEVLRQNRQPVCVEGHTDDQQVQAGKPYLDNYDLSLARAAAVARQLAVGEGLDPARLRVSALGGSRPVAPNDSKANRTKNRRTEIIVLTQGH